MAVDLLNYVFDDAGNAIVGATVSAVGRGAGGTHTTTTNVSGQWSFSALPDDTYDVSITSGGKVRKQKGDVKLQLGAFVNNVGASPIGDASITTQKIANLAVTQAKLALLSVGTPQLIDDAVTQAKIGPGAVGTTELASSAVTAAKISPSAVGTAAIADGAITQAKLAAGVGTGGGTGGGVTDNSVYTAAIQNQAVTSAKLGLSAVGNSNLATDAVTSTKIAPSAVGSTELATGSVTNTKLADNAVTVNKMSSNSVGTAELVDGSVTSAKLAPGVLDGAGGGAIENEGGASARSTNTAITSSSSGTALVTITGLTAGTYLFIGTAQLAFSGALSGVKLWLNLGGLDLLGDFAYTEGQTPATQTLVYCTVATLTSDGSVILKAQNSAFNNNVTVEADGTKLSYVKIA